MKAFKRIYSIVSKVPKGKVKSYKQVAKLSKTSPRIVGFALHANRNPKTIPCHRVIKTDETITKGYAFGRLKVQLPYCLQFDVRLLQPIFSYGHIIL
ncbi:MGMT family protein [Patescibacteria group bacterium]|nr:MGMT family protein [Patescibacteria group bacterium]